ncbi:Vacuolar protein sorting-associated protein 72 [Coemansia erecta]|nr:Vacuolar protein sorting-associated protein 72 [Coemansia sp. RSA 2618]KAJ2829612.1 Vacuolar protein sorting-associated protein 72 [Coemansia erecta]
MIEEERAKIESGQAALSDEDEDFLRKDEVEDTIDSDFEETDSEAEQAAAAASKAIDDMLERNERRSQRRSARKQHIVPRFASSKRNQAQEAKTHSVQTNDTNTTRAARANRTKLPELAVRVSSRASAVRKARESEALVQEREDLAALKRKRKGKRRSSAEKMAMVELTQEQLLEEAERTELENTEKLHAFQFEEAEEKQRQRRMAARKEPLLIRPVAHWESRLAPALVSTGNAAESAPDCVESLYALKHLDETRFPLNPWTKSAPVKPPSICPVTGLPARYFHPRAKVPYANARAYRILEDLVKGQHAYFYDADIWSSTKISE